MLLVLVSSRGAMNCDPHGHDGCLSKASPKARRKERDVGLELIEGKKEGYIGMIQRGQSMCVGIFKNGITLRCA